MSIRGALAGVHRRWLALTDPRVLRESADERVAFDGLKAAGFLAGLEGKRILEIGPKHGGDSRLLAGLGPAELVLVDLPEKRELVSTWLPEVEAKAPTRYVEGNLLYLSPHQLDELGRFDLVWCLGVVYHNVEQFRLLRRLYDLTADGGRLALESATTRNRLLARMNVVEVHWPETYRGVPTVTHMPSRRALASWLEMVGYADVRVRDIYARRTAWQRAVLTGVRDERASPYVSYGATGRNPVYVAGNAS